MAVIILPDRWQRQPEAPCHVDWTNPLTQHLIVAWNGAQPTINAATDSLVALKNGIGPGDMPGKSLKFEGTAGASNCQYVSIPWTFGTMAAGGGMALVQIYQEQATVGNYRRHLRIYNGAFERLRIFHESTGAVLGYRAVDGTGGGSDQRTPVGSVAGGGTYTIGVSCEWANSGQTYWFRDYGTFVSGNMPATNAPQAGIASATEIGLCTDDSAYEPGKIDCALALVWNRHLTFHELREVVRAPWALFTPRPRRTYFAPPAAGGVMLEQEGFRWRYDDGDEDGATFSAPQDEHSAASIGIKKRLRTIVNVTGTPSTEEFELQYRRVGSPSEDWRKVN